MAKQWIDGPKWLEKHEYASQAQITANLKRYAEN
jgi:hypothetical protein